jgi:hypothetical protein
MIHATVAAVVVVVVVIVVNEVVLVVVTVVVKIMFQILLLTCNTFTLKNKNSQRQLYPTNIKVGVQHFSP